MKSWVPIPILIPVNRGANPGYFPDPGRIGIPRFPGIPAKSGSGQNPEYFRDDPGPIGIGKIPAIFPAKSGRGGAGIGDFGVWPRYQHQLTSKVVAFLIKMPTLAARDRLASAALRQPYRHAAILLLELLE